MNSFTRIVLKSLVFRVIGCVIHHEINVAFNDHENGIALGLNRLINNEIYRDSRRFYYCTSSQYIIYNSVNSK